ncbi:MAG TPA: 3-deoxy-D-manno-octulosonic acid transferase [Planctomycetaceae bacterium]|nr:3-deoxy-D-manno-octulosonic acid transferase [Planctomycetaceae bacterium]
MAYLYNFAYLVVIILASPFLIVSSIRNGKYRQGWGAKFLGLVPRSRNDKPCIWLHAVSVGEVNLLQPILTEISLKHPDWECVISTTTLTGMNLAKRKYSQYTVFYCPLDFSWAVASAFRRIKPAMLVLVELEIWPNMIRTAHKRGCPIVIANGRLSEQSFAGYRKISFLIRQTMRRITAVAAQNKDYASRFVSLGVDTSRVHITGSIKFDGAQTNRNNEATQSLMALSGLDPDVPVILAGSTQIEEETQIIQTYTELLPDHPELKLIIVPRHPERFDIVAEMLKNQPNTWIRRSEITEPLERDSWRILLVDVIGELGAWWGSADIALVGGSFGKRGGQNMIEPAAYGAAVCFGPSTRNFRDVVQQLLDAQAAVVVHDQLDLTEFVRKCLENKVFSENLGTRAKSLVSEQLGATTQTIDILAKAMANSQ